MKNIVRIVAVSVVLSAAGLVWAAPFTYSEGFESNSHFAATLQLGINESSGTLMGWDYCWTTSNTYQLTDGVGIGGSRAGSTHGDSTEMVYHYVSPPATGGHVAINPADGNTVTTTVMVKHDHPLGSAYYGFFGPALPTGFLGGASQFIHMLNTIIFTGPDSGHAIRYYNGTTQIDTGVAWAVNTWYKLTAIAHYDYVAGAWNTWDASIDVTDDNGTVTENLWSATNLPIRNAITSLKSGFYSNAYQGFLDDFSAVQTMTPARLTGTIELSGYLGNTQDVAVRFDFGQGGRVVDTKRVLLGDNGAFSVADIAPGVYDNVSIRAYASLGARLDNITIQANPTVLVNPIELKGADANGDNQISFEDFSILQNNYGQSGASGVNPVAAAAAGTGGCGALGVVLLSVLGLGIHGLGWRNEN